MHLKCVTYWETCSLLFLWHFLIWIKFPKNLFNPTFHNHSKTLRLWYLYKCWQLSLQKNEPSWKAEYTASNPHADSGGHVEACEVSVSSFPFPLAGGGQSGIFGGFYPAVTFPCLLIHVLQDNPVAWVSRVCTVVCSLFMAWKVAWWVGWYQQWWQGLRRQSMSYAWSTGGQWGYPPERAWSLHLEWPWSSHLDSSERCHCQCRGRWSRYLGRAEKTWGSQTQLLWCWIWKYWIN